MVLNGLSVKLMLAALIVLAVADSGRGQSAGAASALAVQASRTSTPVSALLVTDGLAWTDVPRHPLHLNHTPPLFETDRRDDGYRPSAFMQVLKADTILLVRLVWQDATIDSIPEAKTYADVGEPEVYKRQSEVIDKFRDAACIMVPRQQRDGTYPSLIMGDAGHPVTLYYWRNDEGFAIGSAAGRGSTAMTNELFTGIASHDDGKWHVVFGIPIHTESMPIAIALWDGSREHRDGLKYYSLWYEVQ
jgi:hypothetical protein